MTPTLEMSIIFKYVVISINHVQFKLARQKKHHLHSITRNQKGLIFFITI
jgi:septum formation topological specificity factor MinE